MSDTKKRETIIGRIRSLMNVKTDRGATEAEARNAAEAVDRLLATYEIDLTEIEVRDSEIEKLEMKTWDHPVRFVCKPIGDFADCKFWWQRPFGVFLGTEVDVAVAEYLVLLMMRAIDRESGGFIMMNGDYAMLGPVDQRQAVHSFQVGMAQRLSERLGELKSKRDFTVKSKGTDLVVVKGAMIEEAFDTLGIKLGKIGLGGSFSDTSSFRAGRGAGDRVNISAGVSSGGKPAGRIR
jgi:hypothetical protein